ncbi:MAG TPA: AarF/ABC1/UbiB kinase family protein [Acidimicrobiales bacterium]|nr:AarF/ABC1/UbiB kinase family protein [Acidimicrobiales bacterium]
MRRSSMVVAALALLGGAAALTYRRSRTSEGDTLMRRGSAARSAQLAGMSTRMGGAYATHRARRIFASAERRDELDEALQLRTAQEVAATLGNMKGAMMKLGQMVSYVDESLPAPFREALAELQQDAPPMSPALAAGVVADELGAPPEEVFAEWDEVPIAAASIGQVHRAMTHDGRAVAVKVQYPGVADAVRSDLETTDLVAQAMRLIFPNLDPRPIAEEIAARLVEELDYRQEAVNQQEFADAYRDHPFIHIPDVLPELSTGRVLTTELADGVRFAETEAWSHAERDLAAEAIYRFVFGSLYRLHLFNGDPHPGNYLFRPGGRVTFLDFGLVKRFDEHEVVHFERFIQHMVLDPDPAKFRRALEDSNAILPGADATDEELYDAMIPYYELVMHDREVTWTSEYASRVVHSLFDRSSPITQNTSGGGSMFVFINRINLGLYGLFGRLGATANWRRIAEELWPSVGAGPSTELGRLDAAWRAAR